MISIIIRTFNEERYIEHLLKGVFAQNTDKGFEVIVVDSGSSDKTLDIVNSFPVKEVVPIAPDRFSFGYSINQGIKRSSGDFCVFVSAHCYPMSDNWLTRLIEPFSDDKVAVVYGKQRGDHRTKYSEHQVFARWYPDESIKRQGYEFCNNANAAIRRSLWKDYKYNEKMSGMEDIDWAKEAISKGRYLFYSAEAGVFHVHEETWTQIFRRYEREAIAMKEMFKDESFTLPHLLYYFFINVAGDYIHALKDGKLLDNITDIPLFRAMQFLGTYEGYRYKDRPLSAELRRRLYYPKKPDIFTLRKKKTDNAHIFMHREPEIFDISRPLSKDTPVWPGDESFQLTWLKSVTSDGVNLSRISMVSHTGAHIDAPYHFLSGKKRVGDIPLSSLTGTALVLEFSGKGDIDTKFLKNVCIPKGCRKVLFKTANSYRSIKGNGFEKDFISLTQDSAQWLVDFGIQLVGVDGPSVQSFFDKDNRTHEILLKNDIVLLEGIDLSSVKEGIYTLTALPLNIPEAEGAPVRAILTSVHT